MTIANFRELSCHTEPSTSSFRILLCSSKFALYSNSRLTLVSNFSFSLEITFIRRPSHCCTTSALRKRSSIKCKSGTGRRAGTGVSFSWRLAIWNVPSNPYSGIQHSIRKFELRWSGLTTLQNNALSQPRSSTPNTHINLMAVVDSSKPIAFCEHLQLSSLGVQPASISFQVRERDVLSVLRVLMTLPFFTFLRYSLRTLKSWMC